MKYFFYSFFLLSIFSFSQNELEVQEPDYIKTIQLRPFKANDFLPIIKLGEFIVLKFDDLEGDQKNYSYKITHCTYDWKDSNLLPAEYTSGFVESNIRVFENSFNTYQNYTHYELRIPNQYVRLKISGNYLISVLNEDEDVVFTRRFIVYQPITNVGVSIHKARKIDGILTKQNVEFTINHPNLLINNPSIEVKVAIYQNMDWNTVVTDLKPQFYRNNQLIYRYGEETTFFGGNEYLFFDTKDMRTATNNIRRVVLKDLYNTRLYVDEDRSKKPYTYYPDINGHFVIRSVNVDYISVESEYTKTHFFLDYDNPNKKDIYVYGAFNNYQLSEETKMIYNSETELYETAILFKQGFHNYTYATVNSEGIIDLNEINGSFFQTENEYQVLVYLHEFGARYDRVIGYSAGSSVNLQN